MVCLENEFFEYSCHRQRMAPTIIERCLRQAQALDRESAKHLQRLTISDTRSEGMAALVESCVAPS